MQTMTMTAKYKRKSVHSHLEVRGVSRSGLEPYAELLEQSDNGLFEAGFVETVNKAISHYAAGSGCSSPNTAQYLDTSNNNCYTGNTTDRSSSYSTVTYTEYDKEQSAKVQRLFDHIDSELFEGGSGGGTSECQDWSKTYPHFRVLGQQVVASKEKGYDHIDSTTSSATSSAHTNTRTDHSSYPDSFSYGDSSSLRISGSHVRVETYQSSSIASASTQHTDVSYLTEEIFEMDGQFEDIIAMDSDQNEESADSKKIVLVQRQRRSRYPPVTPNACVLDDATNSAMDLMWGIVTDSLRGVLQMYSEHFVLTHPIPIQIAEETDQGDGTLKLPHILNFDNSTLGNISGPMGHSGYPHPHSSMLTRPTHLSAPRANDTLDKLLRVSKIEMVMREKTLPFPDDGTETPLAPIPSNSRNRGARNSSARRAGLGRIKHLNPIGDRVKTPNVDVDEVHGIRGLGLSVSKRLSSPPGMRALPPINQSDLHTDITPPQTTREMTRRGYRASSAIAEESRPVNRDKIPNSETRPSTTHAEYLTDQSGNLNAALQRSYTPMDKPVRLKHDVSLGITGSSLIGPHIDEEGEGRYDAGPNHSQWVPHPTAGGGYRRSKGPLSSVVR